MEIHVKLKKNLKVTSQSYNRLLNFKI